MISFSSESRILVTGASSGIGERVALLLNELGATVVAVARNEARLEGMRQKAKNPSKMFVEIADLSADIDSLPGYVKGLKDKYGKLRGMALCAGISQVLPVRALEYNDIKSLFDINYFSPVMMTKAFCDKRIHDGSGSAIVAISSIASVVQAAGMTSYAGAKAALVASLKSIAKEVAPLGVRINSVSPAMVNTPMAKGTDDLTDVNAHHYPFGFAEPEDVANMIAFLLSEKAKWISGQNYVMDCASF